MTEPSDPKQVYWQAGDLAREFNVTKTTITDWCKFFNIVVKKRTKNRRYFTGEQVFILKRIAQLHRTGCYTLKGIKNHLWNTDI